MTDSNTFFNTNIASPPRNQPSRASAQFTPTYAPTEHIDWDSVPHTPPPHKDLLKGEEMPYNVRVLLDNERGTSSTSSDSEETDTMPDVSPTFKTLAINDWDFGQRQAERRKSEPFTSGSPLIQKIQSVPSQQNSPWTPYLPPKVNVRPCYFAPLNLTNYFQNDKKSYFVTLEGYHTGTQRRFFKIERVCQSFQAKNPANDKDGRPLLYINLWNELNHGSPDHENIFEPWIYAIPQTQFRLVVTISMSHSYEDPYSFDFNVDLRQHALPSKERRTQNLEVVYSDLGSSNNSLFIGSLGNNITLHTQITNERLSVPHGFRDVQQGSNSSKQGVLFDYTTILRQVIVSLPLSRVENTPQPAFPVSMPTMHRAHDVYAKRGSAIMLGQHRPPVTVEECPRSPLSWSNFTPEGSPMKPFSQNTSQQAEPSMPPGMACSKNSSDQSNYMSGGSLFKFKSQGHQRFSIQAGLETRKTQEQVIKRPNRYQSSDFSAFLEGDKSPLKVLEAYVNAVNSRRRGSQTSETSAPSNFSNMISRFQSPSGPGVSDNNTPAKGASIADVSSYSNSMAELSYPEYPEDDENVVKSSTSTAEEFRVEEHLGRIADFAMTYQGSKSLQKFITSNEKDKYDPLVQELSQRIGELMLDPHANYMIQTLIQNGSQSQRLHLLQSITPHFNSIARDKKGTHSLQAIVAQINNPTEFNLMKNIVGNSVFELSMDPRANYVIQKLINTIPVESSQFLYQPLFNNFVQVANNSFGLLVLKQVMGRVEPNEALKKKVVELTCTHFEKLVQNQYGNYAIQHIIEFYPKDSIMIMNKVLAKIIPYSSQKISSNVIEKCLAMSDELFRKRVVDEILKNGRLGDLLKNKYGNFVTLQLLAASANSEKQRLMQEIFRCANSFNGTKYKNRWLKFVQENPLNIKWNGEGPNQEDNAIPEESKAEDNENLGEEERKKLKKAAEEKRLEEVKRIWREMTKDEKNDVAPFQGGKPPGGKKHYN